VTKRYPLGRAFRSRKFLQFVQFPGGSLWAASAAAERARQQETIRTKPRATAVRFRDGFAVTSTMATSPRFRKCVSFAISFGACRGTACRAAGSNRAASRQHVYPLAHGNVRPLRANHQEAVASASATISPDPCQGNCVTRASRPSHSIRAGRKWVIGPFSWTGVAKLRERPAEAAAPHHSTNQWRAAQTVRTSPWSRQDSPAARRQASPGTSQTPQPPGRYGDACKMKFRAQVAQHLLHQIIFAHRYAPERTKMSASSPRSMFLLSATNSDRGSASKS